MFNRVEVGPHSKTGCKPGEILLLKIGFQNAIFKNLLVRNYKAQGPGGHNFTLTYKGKTSNDIFSLTTNGNLTKLHRNDPWMVPYQSCSNRSIWLH